MRTKVRKGLDRKIFKKTASASKTINLRPAMMRGGIRL